MRESVFNILTSMDRLEGARVLDLFAGTGALGIEAVSRGATAAVLVDSSADAVAVMRGNLSVLGADSQRAEVVRADAAAYLAGAGSFDLVFADPPYAYDGWDTLLGRLHPRAGLLVAESAAGPGGFPASPLPGWETVTVRRYGGTVVSIVQPVGQP